MAGLPHTWSPGALLILDLVNPSPEWVSAGDGVLVHQMSGPFPDAGSADWLMKVVARTTSFESQAEESSLVYDRTSPGGAVLRSNFRLQSRLIFRFEAELLLESSGFGLRGVYGSYDLGEYQSSSSRMILVAERR